MATFNKSNSMVDAAQVEANLQEYVSDYVHFSQEKEA